MKIRSLIALNLVLGLNLSFAAKMLGSPQGGPECHESYEAAAQPKSAGAVLSAMQPVCERRGGLHVLHKIFGDDKEPQGITLICVGNTPDNIIFSCYFPVSYFDL